MKTFLLCLLFLAILIAALKKLKAVKLKSKQKSIPGVEGIILDMAETLSKNIK